jgi:hypothetical protein
MNFRNPEDLKLTGRPIKKSKFKFLDSPMNPDFQNLIPEWNCSAVTEAQAFNAAK